MTTTQNLHLPQWEKTDRLMMDDFNDAMQSIDAAVAGGVKIASGSYDGEAGNLPYNGYQLKTIELGFRPKFLLITTGSSFSNATSAMLIGNMQINNSNGVPITQITDTGFIAGTMKYESDISYPELNSINQHYKYLAIG